MPKKLPSINGPRKRAPDTRPSPSDRGYGTRWQRIRKAILLAEPLCRACAAKGEIKPAEHVDHIIPLAQGGTHEARNLQPLCHACHSRKTVMEDGGFGRRRRHG